MGETWIALTYTLSQHWRTTLWKSNFSFLCVTSLILSANNSECGADTKENLPLRHTSLKMLDTLKQTYNLCPAERMTSLLLHAYATISHDEELGNWSVILSALVFFFKTSSVTRPLCSRHKLFSYIYSKGNSLHLVCPQLLLHTHASQHEMVCFRHVLTTGNTPEQHLQRAWRQMIEENVCCKNLFCWCCPQHSLKI